MAQRKIASLDRGRGGAFSKPAFGLRSNQVHSYGNYKNIMYSTNPDPGRLNTTSHGAGHATSWDSRVGWNFPGPDKSRPET